MITADALTEFGQQYLDPNSFRLALPQIWEGFKLNIELMLYAEAAVLVFALILALMRTAPGKAMRPVRWLAVLYIDYFRAVPLILVALAIATGFPALDPNPSNSVGGIGAFLAHLSPVQQGILALTITYSAYVAEVYRSGIEGVHPSQRMAARSLGLNHMLTMRFVVLPQAIRRIIPPLLNDFIGLQKDTAIIGVAGVTEAVNSAQEFSQTFANFTGYFVASLFFVFTTIPMTRYLDALIAARDDKERAQLG